MEQGCITTAHGTQVDWVRSGSSYCAESDRRLLFGLGKDTSVSGVTAVFPGGATASLANVSADRMITITEPAGPVKP